MKSINLASALGLDSVDRRVQVLRQIDALGSISEAARSLGMSYKAAWQAVETLSSLAGQAMLTKTVGGASGGGALLTEAARAVLEAAAALQKLRTQVISQEGAIAIASSALKLSARNILSGKVISLSMVENRVQVALEICEEATLTSYVTPESRELLGLEEGSAVFAIFKAAAARVGTQKTTLSGLITASPNAGQSGEITLQLSNGAYAVGFGTSSPELSVGKKASLSIDPASVILGVA